MLSKTLAESIKLSDSASWLMRAHRLAGTKYRRFQLRFRQPVRNAPTPETVERLGQSPESTECLFFCEIGSTKPQGNLCVVRRQNLRPPVKISA